MLKPGTIPYDNIIVEETAHRAAAPTVISASRATDIPAFFGEWFMKKLEIGYVKRVNPFSGKPYYISLKHAAAFVFWSKNPEPFLTFLNRFQKDFYFQFTLNNYDNTSLEPNVPPLKKRIDTFRRLADIYGSDRILWRFDPIMLLPEMPVDSVISRIDRVAEMLHGYTNRMTISFLTLKSYTAAKKRLATQYPGIAKNPNKAIPTGEARKKILDYLQALQDRWQKTDNTFSIQSCGMPDDFSDYGIKPSRCIDDDLLAQLFPQNKQLMGFLGTKDMFGNQTRLPDDKGQRKHCHCIPSKDIGAYNTCKHGCLYCYANKQ